MNDCRAIPTVHNVPRSILLSEKCKCQPYHLRGGIIKVREPRIWGPVVVDITTADSNDVVPVRTFHRSRERFFNASDHTTEVRLFRGGPPPPIDQDRGCWLRWILPFSGCAPFNISNLVIFLVVCVGGYSHSNPITYICTSCHSCILRPGNPCAKFKPLR